MGSLYFGKQEKEMQEQPGINYNKMEDECKQELQEQKQPGIGNDMTEAKSYNNRSSLAWTTTRPRSRLGPSASRCFRSRSSSASPRTRPRPRACKYYSNRSGRSKCCRSKCCRSRSSPMRCTQRSRLRVSRSCRSCRSRSSPANQVQGIVQLPFSLMLTQQTV